MSEVLPEEAVRAALRLPLLVDDFVASIADDDVESSPRWSQRFADGLWLGTSGASSRSRGIASVKISTERAEGSRAVGDSLLTLADLLTGELFAWMKAEALTQYRTAAVTIAIARLLGRDQPQRIALIGCGKIAEAHLMTLREVLAFDELVLCARNPRNAQAMLERAGAYDDSRITIDIDIRQSVANAQLVITATSAYEPLLRADWLAHDAHIAAVGAYDDSTAELEADVFARAAIVLVDDREGAALAGDVAAALRTGAITMNDLRTPDELRNADGITLWKSVGAAGHDLIAGWHAWRNWRVPGERTDARTADFRS